MGAHSSVTVKSDALERAGNTLWQGIGVDAVAMVGLGMTDLLSTTDISSGLFWSTLGILMVKSVLTSAATFMVRLKRPASAINH